MGGGGLTDSRGRPVQSIPVDPARGWTPDDVRAWYQRQRDLARARGGQTIRFNSGGSDYVVLSTGSPVGAFLVRSDAVFKYPWSMCRSYGPYDWKQARAYDLIGRGYGGSVPDAFVRGTPEGFDRERALAELSEFDRADLAMVEGDWKTAADNYRDHVALAPSDAAALRLLGIALILKGDVSEGVTSIALAYERDSSLGAQVMDGDSPMSALDYRRAVSVAMHHAANVRTPEAYLAAAALKQGEGVPSVALKMLDKARAAEGHGGVGVKSEVEAALRAALEIRQTVGRAGGVGQPLSKPQPR